MCTDVGVLEGLVQRLPGDAGFDRDIHIVEIDLDDAVEIGRVDDDRRFAVGDDSAGVGGSAAATDDGQSGARCEA